MSGYGTRAGVRDSQRPPRPAEKDGEYFGILSHHGPQSGIIAVAENWGLAIAVMVVGLGAADGLFYYIKLKSPIELLRDGTEHIRANDLDFSIPVVSTDELGQVCTAFETMRLELLKTNQELWRQSEERKRLNSAFAHDLRNPIIVYVLPQKVFL